MTKASNTVDSPWAWRGETLEIRLYIQPGAKATELSGLHDGRLKVRLKAAPVEGKANQALIAYLSDQFKVPKSSVSIKTGKSSRLKTLLVEKPQFLPSQFLTF